MSTVESSADALRQFVTSVTKVYARSMLRSARLWFVLGILAVVFGLLPILGNAARVTLVVAGLVLLLVVTSRVLSPRRGDGDSRAPRDRWPESGGGGGQ
jgi:hypothetical protein